MRTFLTALMLALPGCARKHHHGGHEMPHRFEDAKAWAQRFEDPARDGWQRPDEVLKALALPPDAKVADLGAATGYFAVRLARAVPQGRVYGVDIEPDMVRYLTERAQKEGLANLTAVLGAAEDPKLPEAVDLVLVVDTYHHVEARPAYFGRLVAALTPRGRLVIIDYKQQSAMGPPAELKLAPEVVIAELGQAGWTLEARHEVLPEQYFLL